MPLGTLDVPVGLADAAHRTPDTCILLGLQWERKNAPGHLEVALDANAFLFDYILPN